MRRILVIDRERDTRELYRAALAADGFEVTTVVDSAAALRLVRDWEPHLAVIDVHLGEESGLDLLRLLLEIRPSLCTILVSASDAYRDDFASWLADALIGKRRDAVELSAKVHELLAAIPA